MSVWETAWPRSFEVARTVLLGVLLVILFLRMFEDRFVYFPFRHSETDPHPRQLGIEAEDVWLRTTDGVELHAWYVAARGPEGSGFTVLLLHGNAGNLSFRVDNIAFLHALPVNVLAVDYRGFGRSQGRPSEAGLYRDAEAAYDYLVKTRGVAPERLVVLGQSLGTAVAAELATRRPVAGLILEAGFSSARRVAQRVLWLPGIHHLMRTRFDAAAALKKMRVPFDPEASGLRAGLVRPGSPPVSERRGVPVLVVHCTADPVIPYELGEELYRAANEPKSFHRFEANCHEPLYTVDPADYARRLRAFLARLEPSSQS